MDEEGYLYWTGRRDDIIKSRGEKVSPKEVEDVLYSLPGVGLAAVIGVPDPVLGQAVKAVVVPCEGCVLNEQEVLRHASRHLEDFMVPKRVEIRSDVPRTATGKIDKRALAAAEGAL
jgi:acyl-CoA synthetase (AMP-forming)/AMP-acid ligase II